MADPRRAARMRALARILSGERTVGRAAAGALDALLAHAAGLLANSGYDVSVLDARSPVWRDALADLLPTIEGVFAAAFDAATRGSVNGTYYAARHLEAVTNRLVGVADEVFDVMRLELNTGRILGESIPMLAARVDTLLADSERWANRATTIARTEVISANNAGSYDASRAMADLLGVDASQVARSWLATGDSRTRESHAEADGQQIIGLDSYYDVGGDQLAYPGDPSGSAGEVINCRCVELFSYPGDPDYPSLTAGGTMTTQPVTYALDSEEVDGGEPHTGVLVVALPAADDPVHGIGPEAKHASILFYGDVADQAEGYRDTLQAIVAGYAATVQPFTETVTGVESLGDNGARVWMLDPAGQLATINTDLPDYDTEATPPPSDYPSYLPHVTVGYPDPELPEEADGTGLVPELEEAAAQVTSITFDRLAVWWADEATEYPLAQEAPVTDDQPTDTEAAAGQVLLTSGAGDHSTQQLLTMASDLGMTPLQLSRALLAAMDEPVGDLQAAPTLAPGEAPAGGPALAQDIASDGEPFYGIIWPEATVSGDARMIAAGASSWRDLPLPLMYQDATQPGHDGAVRVGRIDTLTRDETTYDVPVIRYAGVWDTSDTAMEARRQVDSGVVRGISVDGVSVTVELRDSQGEALDPMVDDFPDDGVVIEAATAVDIAGGTICSVPAFHQAYIANGTLADRAEPEPGWGGTAAEAQQPAPEGALAASAAPAWSLVAAATQTFADTDFDRPAVLDNFTTGCPVTITPDGRVFGHLAAWGQCHIGVDGICTEPPTSHSGYAHYAVGSVLTEAGRVHVGQLTMDTGHADLRLGARPAQNHYDDTGAAWADVAIGEDHIGIWYAGRIRPGLPAEAIHAIQASGKVSGDWREVVRGSGQLELVAALLVNVHGFSIPRPALAASGGRATALVASGIVQRNEGQLLVAQVGQALDTQAIAAAVVATLDRRERTRAVQARVATRSATRRQTRAAAAAARMTKEA